MHVVLGASGHVGSAVARTLLAEGEPVTVVLRDPAKAAPWEKRGAKIALADVHDVDALRAAFTRGARLFLLNPPAPPSTDTDAEERSTVDTILAAVDGAGLEKIVAQSTYGAQPGEHIGDLGVLYRLEQALAGMLVPATLLRAAYFMSNWDAALESARTEGTVPTFFPPDLALPMVAPVDIGAYAARLMMQPTVGSHAIEGPRHYTANDVAEAFAKALERPVKAVQIPERKWTAALAELGFSPAAAESFATMMRTVLEGVFPDSANAVRGETTLESYIDTLVVGVPFGARRD